jgi:ABC-type uncharacterized transport system permease subunit
MTADTLCGEGRFAKPVGRGRFIPAARWHGRAGKDIVRPAMTSLAPANLLFALSAFAAMVPATILGLRHGPRRGMVFWAVTLVATVGPAASVVAQLGSGLLPSLATSLWLTIVASLVLFVAIALVSPAMRQLTPLLLPYLLLMGAGALIASFAPGHGLAYAASEVWLDAHVVVSLATYGLLTLAAVAGCAAMLQERALKRKQPTGLSRTLPSLADGEALQVRLLAAAEIVLGLGVLTGVATQYLGTGELITFDHKTLLSLLAFATIGVLLWLHHRTGLRGRRAARIVLVAYLLITLAYPGVKFVTDVLIGGSA